MHELSIAQNIVEIVVEEARKSSSKKVTEIELEIGSMAGIVLEALEFALDEAVKNTVLADSRRIFKEIRAEALCTKCENLFNVDDFFAVCPNCGCFETDIIKGKELKIKKLIVQ